MIRKIAMLGGIGLVTATMTACISVRQPIATTELPPAWSAALSPGGESANAIAGTYRNTGQWLWNTNRPATTQSLVRWVLLLTDAEFRALGPEMPDEIQIGQVEPGHLEVKGLRGGVVLWTRTVEVVSSTNQDGVTIERSLTQANGHVGAVVGTRLTARLLKGRDGRLYGHFKTGSAGVAFLLPMSSSVETWGRWDPR